MIPVSVLFCLLLVPGSATTTHAARKDSLIAQFYTSFSARNPTQGERTVVIQGVNLPDTTVAVTNPFDYELAVGISGTYGTIAFKMDYQYERQNGLHYVNQEYELRHRPEHYEIGVRLRDTEEDDFYLLSGYIEGKVYGWVGVGVTRQYSGGSNEKWLKNGATLARFSLARNEFHFMKLNLFIRAEYEVNPSRSRIFFYTEIKNFKRGRFALVPLYRHERLKPSDGPARSSYQGKIKLTIDI